MQQSTGGDFAPHRFGQAVPLFISGGIETGCISLWTSRAAFNGMRRNGSLNFYHLELIEPFVCTERGVVRVDSVQILKRLIQKLLRRDIPGIVRYPE